MARLFLSAAAALLVAVGPAESQESARQSIQTCPEAESGTTPVELRIGGMVVRAEFKYEGTTAAGDSTRVQARLVTCENTEQRSAVGGDAEEHPDQHAIEEAGAATADGLLRVLSDLRLGIQLTPSADGRCFRAQLDVRAEGPDARLGDAPDRPLGIELCGLPFGRDSVAEPEPAR